MSHKCFESSKFSPQKARVVLSNTHFYLHTPSQFLATRSNNLMWIRFSKNMWKVKCGVWIANWGSRIWTLGVSMLNVQILVTEAFRRTCSVLLSVKPCCAHVNRYRHMLKQSNEWYQENLSSLVDETYQDMSRRYYIKQLVDTKWNSTKYPNGLRKNFTTIFPKLQVI